MPLFPWACAALASEPALPLVARIPAGAWQASAGLGAGLSADATGMLVLSGFEHAAGAQLAGDLPWDLRLGGNIDLDGSGTFRYGETLRVGVSARSGFGGVAGVAFGGSPGWSEPALMGRWRGTRGALTGEVTAGPVGRGEEGRFMPGAGTDAELEWRATPAVSLGAWGAARTWVGEAAPAVTAMGGLFVSGTPRHDTRLTLALGARGASAHDDPAAAWTGLPSPGAADVWALARAGWSPRGPVGLFAQGGAVTPVVGGGSLYGWATAGVEVHYGQVGAPRPPDATVPPPPKFRIHAPAASSVEVIGSFNDWTAEPLHPSAGGAGLWELDRALPSGRHSFVYLLDGVPFLPQEVTRRQPDGFGGENGVIEAP